MKILKTFLINYNIILVLLILISGCGKTDDKMEKTNQSNSKTENTIRVTDGKFVCPMHPLEQTNDPAKCSICKMKLISKDDHNQDMKSKIETMKNKYIDKSDISGTEIIISLIKSDECEKYIIDVLKKDEGIVDYILDIINKKVIVMYDKTKSSSDKIEKVISDAGFDANDKKAVLEVRNKLPDECKP